MANQADIPEEIKEYYRTERRERTGVAWLLAFGTLIVTILLGAGIFFAGRWAYRQVAGTEEAETPTGITQSQGQEADTDSTQDTDQRGGAAQEQNNEDNPGETEGASDAESAEEEDATAPVTGSSEDEDLPGTGPSGTLTAFMAVSFMGYLAHRFWQRHSSRA